MGRNISMSRLGFSITILEIPYGLLLELCVREREREREREILRETDRQTHTETHRLRAKHWDYKLHC